MTNRDYRLAVVKTDGKYQVSYNPRESFEEFADSFSLVNRLLLYLSNEPRVFSAETDISGLSVDEVIAIGRIREIALKIRESDLEESVATEAVTDEPF